MKKVPILQIELEFQVSQSRRQKEMSWKMTGKGVIIVVTPGDG